MRRLRFTLVCDGVTDAALLPILSWIIRQHVGCPLSSEWLDPSKLPSKPKSLAEKIRIGVEFFPCDLLFVHRDAEKLPHIDRVSEIEEALSLVLVPNDVPAVCVVPVRMTEAWLLFDEQAIRSAASNSRGKTPLGLPRGAHAEHEPDPKQVLYAALRDASELNARRRKQLNVSYCARRVSTLIEDFSPLRALSAFRAVEESVRAIVNEMG
jgi:hypothetical protein